MSLENKITQGVNAKYCLWQNACFIEFDKYTIFNDGEIALQTAGNGVLCMIKKQAAESFIAEMERVGL